MFIERPPFFLRLIWNATWRRVCKGVKTIYLTFDDGPNTTVTPEVLDILDKYDVKATFFCVGDNVRKNPEVFSEVINRGHSVGNHTMHHLKGFNYTTEDYISNVHRASEYIDSKLFRPPYGRITLKQHRSLRKDYNIIMWDLITRDYNQALSVQDVFDIVKRYARNGSIIVFHDSLKAKDNVLGALPLSIEYLKTKGYSFSKL